MKKITSVFFFSFFKYKTLWEIIYCSNRFASIKKFFFFIMVNNFIQGTTTSTISKRHTSTMTYINNDMKQETKIRYPHSKNEGLTNQGIQIGISQKYKKTDQLIFFPFIRNAHVKHIKLEYKNICHTGKCALGFRV